MILDCHTHNALASNAIICVAPSQFDPEPGKIYSVGIHPWDTEAQDIDAILDLVAAAASHPQVVAIGETGLDNLRGAPMQRQIEIFGKHIAIAEQVGKPLIIHMVRTAQEIIRMRKTHSNVDWIIHGFRGNERIAAQLLQAGCHLSYGLRFNPKSVEITPLDRLLIETDNNETDIHTTAAAVAQAKNLTPEQLIDNITQNTERVFTQFGH